VACHRVTLGSSVVLWLMIPCGLPQGSSFSRMGLGLDFGSFSTGFVGINSPFMIDSFNFSAISLDFLSQNPSLNSNISHNGIGLYEVGVSRFGRSVAKPYSPCYMTR